MLNSISISNFKAIQDKQIDKDEFDNLKESDKEKKEDKFYQKRPLILDNLTKVNYLVGPNGCGKSSVLEYMFQKELLQCSKFRISKETVNFNAIFSKYIDFSTNNLTIEDIKEILTDFEMNKKDWFYQYPSASNGDTSFVFKLDKNLNFEKLENKLKSNNEIEIIKENIHCGFLSTNPQSIKKKFFTYNNYQKQNIVPNSILINFEENIKIEEQIQIEFFNKYFFENEAKKVQDINKNVSNDSLQIIHYDHTKTFLKDFTSGYQNLFSLYHSIKNELNETYKNPGNLFHPFNIFLVEEPENGLHPKFQKLLPQIFEDFSKDYFVSFLISTHSPFIISAAAEFGDSQKVYLIENGICVNSKGNSGNEVKHRVATKMLGAKIKDFTPSKVVFCADSEKIFLELINEGFYNLDIIFVKPTPDSGDDSVLKLAENTGKFASNFYPDSKIFYYIDEPNQNNVKLKSEKLKKQKEFELVVSDKNDFESKFGSKINKTTGNIEFCENGQNKTLNKVEHAKFQAEELITMKENGKKEFEKIFPELKLIFDK